MMLRRTRRGFTLIEMAIVLGIIVILAALGTGSIGETLSRYRTRQAANVFAKQVQEARLMAMSYRLETRIAFDEFDTDLDDDDNNGRWLIQIGDRSVNAQNWDTLPYEGTGIDNFQSEGTIDISPSGNDALRGVSLIAFEGTVDGPGSGNSDSLVFDTQGWVSNPESDFSNGSIDVVFVNKLAHYDDITDRWIVRVYRSGMTRIDTSMAPKYDTTTISSAPLNTEI